MKSAPRRVLAPALSLASAMAVVLVALHVINQPKPVNVILAPPAVPIQNRANAGMSPEDIHLLTAVGATSADPNRAVMLLYADRKTEVTR